LQCWLDPVAKAGGVDAFQGTFRELAWIDGSTVRFELRLSKVQDRSTHATELVNLAPDVLVSVGTLLTGSLAERTNQVPIVFINASNPLGIRLQRQFGQAQPQSDELCLVRPDNGREGATTSEGFEAGHPQRHLDWQF
jgi:hypothetical protein